MTHSAAAIAQGVALRANIIAVLTARPGLSTTELCHSIADAPPMRVTGVAGKLRDQQILRSERSLTTTRSGAQRIGCRWFIADQPKPPRVYVNQPEKTDGPRRRGGRSRLAGSLASLQPRRASPNGGEARLHCGATVP
jgi:hypothetical protein